MNNTWFIYALTDPRDGRIRYVGKTVNLKKRLRDHVELALTQREKNRRAKWIRDLVSSGRLPVLSVLETGTGSWKTAEKRWIRNFRDAGLDLTNSTDGGDGCDGYRHSAETLAKMSTLFKKGHRHSPETLAKLRFAAKRRGPEWREKLRVAALSRSPETKTHMLEGRKNMSPEAKARISAAVSLANKTRMQSAETRAKLSATMKGRVLPAAFVAHIGLWHDGLKRKTRPPCSS